MLHKYYKHLHYTFFICAYMCFVQIVILYILVCLEFVKSNYITGIYFCLLSKVKKDEVLTISLLNFLSFSVLLYFFQRYIFHFFIFSKLVATCLASMLVVCSSDLVAVNDLICIYCHFIIIK